MATCQISNNIQVRFLTDSESIRITPSVSDSVLDRLDDVAPPRAARAVAVEVFAAAALAVAHEHARHVARHAAAHVAPKVFDNACIIQGDPAPCSKPPVDIDFEVAL